jgi:hypothetical protein
MALIVITIRDTDRGVAVQLQDEPKVTEAQTDFTPAQTMGAVALNAIHKELNSKEMNKPRLIVVGADEMPG